MLSVAIRLALRRIDAALSDGWVVVHLVVSSIPAWFAICFAVPPSTFASSPNSFRFWAELATEGQWAWICAGVAVLGFASMTFAHALLRMVSAGILAGFHGWAAMAFLISNPHGTGSGTYGIIAAAATLAMLKRGRRRA